MLPKSCPLVHLIEYLYRINNDAGSFEKQKMNTKGKNPMTPP